MATKEKREEIISKWEPLLDDLSNSEVVKYKYSQSYERIVKNNDPKDYKVLLGLAHRVFLKDKNIEPTRGKEKILINEFEDADFSVGGGFIMDLIIPFVEALSDMIVEECHNKDNKLSHLEIKNNKIYMVY